MIYLVADDLSGRERLGVLQAAFGDPSAAALNTTSFDGAKLDLADVRAACEAMPFLSDRRLVVVRGALARGGKEIEEALAEYVAQAPPTCDLVFLEPEPPTKGHLLRAVERLAQRGAAEIVRDPALDERGAVDWVRQRASVLGARMELDAAMALVGALGTDRTALERELEKLVLLAAPDPVSRAHVQELVPSADDVRVFELVDAIGNRNARAAIRAWRALTRSGEDAHRLLSMVARQFRLLVQAGELAAQRRPTAAIAQAVGLPPRIAAGLVAQSRSWSEDDLQRVIERLVVLDRDSKTGGAELGAALEALIAELVVPRRRR